MESIASISYIVSGCSFILLAIFCNQRLFHDTKLRAFILALLGNSLWSISHLPPLADHSLLGNLIPETLRNALWYYFLITALSSPNKRNTYSLLHLVWLTTLGVLCLQLFNSDLGAASQWGLIATPVAGLFLLEQLYRNTAPERLISRRYIYFALAGMFSFDLYLHVWGYMFQAHNPQLMASRGLISCIIALFILLGLKREGKGQSSFAVSREVVFYSTSLVITGIFLMLVAAGGYYIKVMGGSFGVFVQSVYVFSFVSIAVVLLTSPRLRASVKVNLNKHLFRHKYDYRLEWQRLINTLTQRDKGESTHEMAIRALGQIYGSPKGGIWILDDDTYHLKASNCPSINDSDVDSDHSLINYFKQNEKVLVCQELKYKPEYYNHLQLPSFINDCNFWFLTPLVNQGELIGFIGLCRPELAEPLVWEDFDLIRAASLQIASFIATENKSQDLMQAKQFDAYSKLTAFIMHDLKNLIAQQSLVVKNAAKHKDNPEFIEDAINTIDNSVKRMNSLLDQLKQDHEIEKASNVNLKEVLVGTVRKCHNREPRPALRLPEDELMIRSSAEQLGMIFGHVIRNAQEATHTNGFIDISVNREENFAVVCIEDNGSGMSQEFIRNRLFKPFDTTKAAKGMGIGAYQTREFIRQAGGNVDIQSEEGQGTRFTISIPLINVSSAA